MLWAGAPEPPEHLAQLLIWHICIRCQGLFPVTPDERGLGLPRFCTSQPCALWHHQAFFQLRPVSKLGSEEFLTLPPEIGLGLSNS